jgi:hypothetical protein
MQDNEKNKQDKYCLQFEIQETIVAKYKSTATFRGGG